MRLLEEDETIEQLLRLPPESILLRWFNYQLQEAGHVGRVANFSSDIQDAENYSVLLHQVNHTVVLIPLLSSQKHNLKVLVLEIHSIFSTQLGAFLAAVSFFPLFEPQMKNASKKPPSTKGYHWLSQVRC